MLGKPNDKKIKEYKFGYIPINPYLIKHNDRVIGMFWRDFKRDKRNDTKIQKRKQFITKLKKSRKFKIKIRKKD